MRESSVDRPIPNIWAVSCLVNNVFSGHSVMAYVVGFITETPCEFQYREYGTQIVQASFKKK